MLRTLLVSFVSLLMVSPLAADYAVSHPARRKNPAPNHRPKTDGPAKFVDATRGNDAHSGTEQQPWRSLRHALRQLAPGDTLYLRGGTYYEQNYVALAGSAEQPIVIRSYPGEQAILDGSYAEFFTAPETCWEPYAGGGPDEYRSVKRYPNLREVIGTFGDSMIGLQTYYHAADLRTTNELVDWEDWDRQNETDIKPLYFGPGMWYDRTTGHIHLRLAATHLPLPLPNYTGPTDPCRLQLIIGPYDSIALNLDQARHVKLQDLVIRGGGYTTIVIDQARHVEFDNCTVWCGTYGMRVSGTDGLKFLRSALYGNVAPWTFRSDGSKRDYPNRPHRNLSRLNTHALLELATGAESSVYAFPQNDNWEFAYSEFAAAHDGLYFGAISTKFHHNLIEELQDDGIYLSPMYLRHKLDKTDPQLLIYQNVFRGVLTALAFGGPEGKNADQVYIYRNVFDLRTPIPTARMTTRNPRPSFSTGHPMGDHGSPPWSQMNIYHNTFVMAEPTRDVDMATSGAGNALRPRRVFNNIYLHLARLPALIPPNPDLDVVTDGNLYWSPAVDARQASALFTKYRASPQFAQSKSIYAAGSTTHSLVADPKFTQAVAVEPTPNEYRLAEGSPAIDAGVELPANWPDPLRSADSGKPDLGALPHGSAPLEVGRTAKP